MSDQFNVKTQRKPEAPGVKDRSKGVSLVWLLPIVAALIGLSMAAHSILSKGPEIKVTFLSAEGLVAGKTQVKYKNVVIGQVSDITLSDDRDHAVATIQLDQAAKAFTAQDSRFWVVRPRIGAQGISGVDTLLSGAFIGADPGESHDTRIVFKGLESPPPITYGQKGKRYTLSADDLGSLDVGSPVYYRRIEVGQVVSYQLSADGKGVEIEIFVTAPNDAFITTGTRFWNASGVDVSFGADGLKVNTQSVASIVSGGIAFMEPPYGNDAKAADERGAFPLFKDQATALAPPDGEPFFIRMHFDQSMRGLAINAPVEFLGVNIGKVVSTDLDFNRSTNNFAVVVGAVIYPQRLGQAYEQILTAYDAGHDEDGKKSAQLISIFVKEGLRAQVKTANLLTGQLYVSFDFVPHAQSVPFNLAARPMEMPTIPGSLDKLQDQVQRIVEKLSKIPVERIADNLNANLVEMRKTLQQVNGQVLPQMRDALGQTQKTLSVVNESFAEDSPQRQQFGQVMDEVQRSARSVRVLSDLLSRHPEALIRGRVKEGEPDSFRSSTSASSAQPAESSK